jgi:hypothetical protein
MNVSQLTTTAMMMMMNNNRIPLLLSLLVCSTTMLLLAPVVDAWVVPDLQRAFSVAAMAAALTTNAAPPAVASPPSSMILADAATTTVVANSNFAGSYADPFHPNCRRVIATVSSSPGKVSVSGTDGNPGCPPDGNGRAWQLEGTVSGSTIVVDFSPKGGPADLKGTYVSSGAGRIQWPDGNSWTKK